MNLLTFASVSRPRRATVVTGGATGLSWTAVSGAAGYRLYSTQTDPGATEVYNQAFGSGLDVGNVTSYTTSGFAAGTWYFAVSYYLAADGEGEVFEGELSNKVTKVIS